MTSRESHPSKGSHGTLLKEYKLDTGLIHYYFGDGKGKTSSLIGTIIRALGNGLKPILIQFLKLHTESDKEEGFFMGEINFLSKFIPIRQFGSGSFIRPDKKPRIADKKLMRKGFDFAKSIILQGNYDLVALDEIINAISLNLIKLEELLKLLKNKPDHVEVICTGFMYYSKLKRISNYVVHFGSLNHPYKDGIDARRGIEY
ncbi:MAG: Cob(I)alamin adenosyltransferase [Promethearchaeota archaeon]|nr:MAG: Cob(I)alamin adenosyltransferase [Candidatus Lokiarchaeota archaeon]